MKKSRIEIPDKYKSQIIDVICGCEDDMDRVEYVWQFAVEHAESCLKVQSDHIKSMLDDLDVCQKKYNISQDRYLKALTRCNIIEEWVLEYRDQLKKENVFHKNQGIINAINELLYPNTTHTLNFKGKCAHVHTEIQEFVQKYRCLDCGIYI